MQLVRSIVAAGALAAAAASANVELEFIPATPAHRHAAKTYERIWKAHGERIVAALEARTCLPFAETSVAALVADATSNSGGPRHPMRLRATHTPELKRSTLVHELGHRHLWQLGERIHGIDGHETLFLVLDRVWADVWGEGFAEAGVRAESEWDARYDYAAAWDWARSLSDEQRQRIWNELLARNGFAGRCRAVPSDVNAWAGTPIRPRRADLVPPSTNAKRSLSRWRLHRGDSAAGGAGTDPGRGQRREPGREPEQITRARPVP